ncbi:LysM peptidoglycan-binding domain-containing protein [Enterococcus durans]|uniref:LysM peptidoglycan-binding domain-containing protein n=1 Tax=Enterococcus durans TaxID=53345 RepID=A0A5N0YP33_9ENTE|nr:MULTISPECIES: LysM peptidoglycan-binding domain-containing protein [Enterococcus]KAA9178370.1 LysM peptidoglycan-binding domain-containing protein [Enterococcus durans]KAA9184584.1 LysM peptidoglycan-binding domain-containing protein [Enterococcus durans]KAA9185693.1 LysM peptidoglycan-binding domain-containing protein [Enterococcus durans]KAA9189983.1 LysM peptidoglycan-binding domain-containing protein [Enterococcus durans]KAA9191663.1 LysM peptidoglycan-binding domain-containing protein 
MKLLRVMAIGATVGGVALAMTTQEAGAQEWTPRTVEQIKKDINENGYEYDIVWGDTLSIISEATNISIQKLSDINKISDIDWIYAGSKLIISDDVVTIQNREGEIVAQSTIQNQDKVNPSQPVGQPVISEGTTINNRTNTVEDNAQASDQKTVTSGNMTSSILENNGSSTQTPTQSDNNSNKENTDGGQTTPSNPDSNEGNQGDSANGNTGEGQTTPSNPGDNEGNQDSSTDGNNGSTNPSTPQVPTIVDGYIGNSGMLFDTAFEANVWADGQLADDSILGAAGNGWQGFDLIAVFYSDGSKKFSINFY